MKANSLKQKYIKSAREIFKRNLFEGHSGWKNTSYKFIAPAIKEYTYQWLWDTSFHAIVLSHFDVEWAKSEIRTFLVGQWRDGFIPHVVFWGNKYFRAPWTYIESKPWFRPKTTAITQPPTLALAVEEIYKKDPDQKFLKEVLPKIASYHRWLVSNRDPDEDGLIAIISPNESGMDELPVFQYVMGYHADEVAKLHYYYRKADFLNQVNLFNSKKILSKDYFNVEEILFNTVYIEASRSLSRLFQLVGSQDEAAYFLEAANKSEKALLTKCWDTKDKIFYSLYSKHELKAKVKTAASLVPLFLDGLTGAKLTHLVEDHLLSEKEFWTKYPIPSVAKDESYYEPSDVPHFKRPMKMLFRGPTWINLNWFIVKGLRKHGYADIAQQLVKKMSEMISKYGFREYYNPETGEGYRREHFGWSTLIVDLL